jgi:hypothetical protein
MVTRRHIWGLEECLAHELSDDTFFSCLIPSKVLQQALEEFGEPWDLNPGDGAFYGPKVNWGPSLKFYLSVFCLFY